MPCWLQSNTLWNYNVIPLAWLKNYKHLLSQLIAWLCSNTNNVNPSCTFAQQAATTVTLLVITIATIIISIVILNRHDISYLSARSDTISVCDNNIEDESGENQSAVTNVTQCEPINYQNPQSLDQPSASGSVAQQRPPPNVHHDTSASDTDVAPSSPASVPRARRRAKVKVRRVKSDRVAIARTPYGEGMRSRGPYLAKTVTAVQGVKAQVFQQDQGVM